MDKMQQWKATFYRSDGSLGLVFMELPNEPMNADLMDSILRWDTNHRYLQTSATPSADRLEQAAQFFEMNHISCCRVRSLDDVIDSSSDA